MIKHTPGPWTVDDTCRVSTDWSVVGFLTTVADCRIGGANRDTQTANARLISAAPDMLEALEALHDEIDEYQRINNLGGHDNHVMKQARAAIAKAKGAA